MCVPHFRERKLNEDIVKFEDTIYAFLKELGHFDYHVSSADSIWELIFAHSKNRWSHVHVTCTPISLIQKAKKPERD